MAHSPVPADQLKQIIAGTLSRDSSIRKPAEEHLQAAKNSPGHLIEVLKVVASSDAAHAEVRQAAAVHFKNVIKTEWEVSQEDGNHGIFVSPEDRNVIKTHLVQLMCTTPPQIQLQLSESIRLIAVVDYPQNWSNLLGELVQQFESLDPNVVNGVLKTADSIFRGFRYVGRSDDLYRVLDYTLQGVQAPILALFQTTGQAIDATPNDANQLKTRMETLRLICSVIYSLNYQDLPEFFEDNMAEFMQDYARYLIYNNPVLVDPNELTKPSPIDELQFAIIKILHLYGCKDENSFLEFLPQFATMVWNLLMALTHHPKHDALATTSIQFLGMLIPRNSQLFQEDANLRLIVINIVIPNLTFREIEAERFQNDPSEYIQTEVEGSQGESRRRCSQDLLRGMCGSFWNETTRICSEHVNTMLSEYAAGDPNTMWASKDAAIHLMMGVAILRELPQEGVIETNPAVDVTEFFQTHILPELQDNNHASRPVLKATSLKFAGVFRNQISKENLIQLVIPCILIHLNSPVVVVHTFAAYALERILIAKDDDGRRKIGSVELRTFLNPLFTALFSIIDNLEYNENAYVMKCVMRSLETAGRDIVPVTQTVVEKLTNALDDVAPNPRDPEFNHYLFESIAVLVKNACSQDPDTTVSFEPLLFEPFTSIFQNDVAEFFPYVLQILAQLLEYRPGGTGLGQAFTDLLTPLLSSPSTWEKKRNVPALARLLQAYIRREEQELVPQADPVLTLVHKLLASRATEKSGFEILNSVITHFPQEEITSRLAPTFELLLVRSLSKLTPRYSRLVTTFFAVYIGRFGAQTFLDALNAVQIGTVSTLLQQVWIPRLVNDPPVTIRTLPGDDDPPTIRVEAKVHAVGLTRLLCEGAAVLMADDNGRRALAGALSGLVALLMSDSLTTGVEEDETMMDEAEFRNTSTNQLVFATKISEDPFEEITDARFTCLQFLHALITKQQAEVLIHDIKLISGLESMFEQAGLSFE